MEEKRFFKRMVEFNRIAFNQTFSAAAGFQEQCEKLTGAAVERCALLPEEGRKIFGDWMKNRKQGRENFKKIMDESFDRWESLFAGERPER